MDFVKEDILEKKSFELLARTILWNVRYEISFLLGILQLLMEQGGLSLVTSVQVL